MSDVVPVSNNSLVSVGLLRETRFRAADKNKIALCSQRCQNKTKNV